MNSVFQTIERIGILILKIVVFSVAAVYILIAAKLLINILTLV